MTRRGCQYFLLVALLMSSALLLAGRIEEDRVSISISVHPLASVDFPAGHHFFIEIPRNASPRGATIQPVRIPFTVTTNAVAEVSLRPSDFVPVVDEEGTRFLGLATGPNGASHALGYDIVVQFPVPSANYAGLPGRGGFGRDISDREGVATLPGNPGEGTAALAADSATHGQRIYGVLHVVSRQHWTPSGDLAPHGDYSGSVEITVGAQSASN